MMMMMMTEGRVARPERRWGCPERDIM